MLSFKQFDKQLEEDWFTKLMRRYVTKPRTYKVAKDILQQVVDKKRKEGKLQHSIEYYAAQIAKQFQGVDARDLASMVEGYDSISEAIDYHTEYNLSIKENIFRPHSEAYYEFFRECRRLWKEGKLETDDAFDRMLLESNAGELGIYEGEEVPLDIPLIEAEYKGKDVELNSPKRGGDKKFYVYVKNDKGNVIKVQFGDTSGLKVKLNDPAARKSFNARHKCDQKKDNTKPGYWACRLPYYAKELGLEGGGSFFW